MKLAYWSIETKTDDLYFDLCLKCDSELLFIIRKFNKRIHAYRFNAYKSWGERIGYFKTFERAVLECNILANASGYRVLTESEMNLL